MICLFASVLFSLALTGSLLLPVNETSIHIFSPSREKPPIAARRKTKSSDGGSSYADELKREVVRPPWQMLKTSDALPPRALTVTSVTQSHDLQVPYECDKGQRRAVIP